jgi:hypothetical protein
VVVVVVVVRGGGGRGGGSCSCPGTPHSGVHTRTFSAAARVRLAAVSKVAAAHRPRHGAHNNGGWDGWGACGVCVWSVCVCE